MWTAGSNFHHLVREERDQKHSLTTNGVYSYVFSAYHCSILIG
jgi:hypothetical protein